MVALVIFAFAGLVLASAYVNVLSAHQAALRRDDFATDRRLVREALRAEPSADKVAGWNDLTLPDEHRARWKATLTATPVADLFDVSLEIELTGADGKKQPPITETCRLLRPEDLRHRFVHRIVAVDVATRITTVKRQRVFEFAAPVEQPAAQSRFGKTAIA